MIKPYRETNTRPERTVDGFVETVGYAYPNGNLEGQEGQPIRQVTKDLADIICSGL